MTMYVVTAPFNGQIQITVEADNEIEATTLVDEMDIDEETWFDNILNVDIGKATAAKLAE